LSSPISHRPRCHCPNFAPTLPRRNYCMLLLAILSSEVFRDSVGYWLPRRPHGPVGKFTVYGRFGGRPALPSRCGERLGDASTEHRRLIWCFSRRQALIPKVNSHAPIQPFLDPDLGVRVAYLDATGKDSEATLPKSNRVVRSHGSSVFETTGPLRMELIGNHSARRLRLLPWHPER
jgi:hypothetical protein